jgi:dTDP-4-dehydrorhamnose 3,5-epimerase
MTFTAAAAEGCFIIDPRTFNDDRGFFFESYNEQKFNAGIGAEIKFVQDNQSFSTKGVLRGLHFQTGEYAQAKLVRVTRGEVLDIAIDLRKKSPTFGQCFEIVLSEENNLQLYIPRGFAHGFSVLSDSAVFQYKCDNYYNKESEGGLHYADPELNIDWGLPFDQLVVSDKDKELPFFKDAPDFGF